MPLIEPEVAYERLVVRAAGGGPGSVESTILSLIDRDGGPEDLRGTQRRVTAALSGDASIWTVDARSADLQAVVSAVAAHLGMAA